VPPLSFLSATRHRDFRLFLTGQFISQCGTWIQTVASGWLVLQLTNSAFAVGLVTALGSLPILLLTLYGGVVADRVNKRRFVLTMQSLMVLEGLTLGILILTGRITVHWVMALAVFFGTLSAFEVPTRQALIADIIPRRDLLNAIALNSSAFNVARVIGPAIAGVLISTAGIAACYLVNAASYLAVIASLMMMRKDTPPIPSTVSPLEALLQGALITIIATFAIFGFSFITMMPVFARDVLHLDASGYGAILSSVGLGAATAAIFMAAAGGRVPQPLLVLGSAISFGLVLGAAALAPSFRSAIVLFTLAGCVMALNGIAANNMLQVEAPDYLRGRVMGFYSFVVLGMAPFGSLQAGWVAEHLGVRASIGIGGAACFVVAAVVSWRMWGDRSRETPDPLAPPPAEA
jgi:MFS family permease